LRLQFISHSLINVPLAISLRYLVNAETRREQFAEIRKYSPRPLSLARVLDVVGVSLGQLGHHRAI
jgi:hypothetical protein